VPPVRAAREWLQQEIAGQPPSAQAARRHLFEILDEVLACVRNHPQGWMEYRAACQFALAQRIPRQRIFNVTLTGMSPPDRAGPVETARLAGEIVMLLEEKPGALEKSSHENALASARHYRDLPASPEPMPPAPWRRATKLFEIEPEKNHLGFLFKPVVSGDSIFVAGFGWDSRRKSELQLVRVPLSGGAPTLLGRIPFDGVILESMRAGFELHWPGEWKKHNFSRYDLMRSDLANMPRAACVAQGNYFLATHRGLLAFPLDGGVPRRFCVTNGLPSDDVHALACLNGRLYVGAGEVGRAGYFFEFKPREGRVIMLASSRRAGGTSPLDEGPPFYPAFLFTDEPQARLLMLAAFNTRTTLGGFWSYEPATEKLTHLAPFIAFFPDVHTYWLWGGAARHDTLAASHLDTAFYLWDTGKNDFAMHIERRGRTNLAAAVWPVQRKPLGGNMQHAPVMLLNDWLWWANPFQRASMTGGHVEDFPALETEYAFAPSETLQLLNDGRHVLAADRFSVWLLELGPKEDRPQTQAD
jgi:hypothetical protein